MDAPLLPWERRLWSGRSVPTGRPRYLLTDFRLARLEAGPREGDEILTQDIRDVHRTESPVERMLGLSTLTIHTWRRRPPFVMRRIRRGQQIAALLDVLASDPLARVAPETASALLAWEPAVERHGFRAAFLALVAVFATVILVGATLHGRAASVTFGSDDAIYPNGEKRPPAEIVRFMESDVMPWARAALGPLKGGPGKVTCATCHGGDADARAWAMPAVAALPQPAVALRGWELYSEGMDAQTRNAIYGYVAEADNQTKAAYMREVVMPGMARLLHRPAYDFTKPYEYNRTRLAFGCYHCHRVK
jgi:hypothetical protein